MSDAAAWDLGWARDNPAEVLDALVKAQAEAEWYRALLAEFAVWSEEHPDIWEEHGEPVEGGHPRHIQCIAPADLMWLEGFEGRIRAALAPPEGPSDEGR